MKLLTIFLLAIGLMSTSGVMGQKCDKCEEKYKNVLFVIDSTMASNYIAKFDSIYRTNSAEEQLNTKAVAFSRDAFLAFYNQNFGAHPDKYFGMNILPVSYDLPLRDNQQNEDQPGIVLAPRGQDCKVDGSGFICGNNSFTSDLSSVSRGAVKYDGIQLDRFCVKYKKDHRNGVMWWNRLYSRSIFMKTAVCSFIAEYLNANANADGIAIYPAVYGERKYDVCGHKRKKQTTVVIVAIVNGKPDFNAFSEQYAKNKALGQDFLALNHGSLCPDRCY